MPLIDVRDITKTYGSGTAETPALRGITFSIDRGAFVAIVGPSGSGKSTLLQILALLDVHTSGMYTFDGRDSTAYTDDERARIRNARMGFVFQQFNLLPRATVLENVTLPLQYSDVPEREWGDRCRAAIARVGIAHRIDHTPAQLSGGEQQRTAIARALVLRPEVVFADEPTGNLDSATGHQVLAMLEELHDRDGQTIILITHDPAIAGAADRTIRLRDGVLDA